MDPRFLIFEPSSSTCSCCCSADSDTACISMLLVLLARMRLFQHIVERAIVLLDLSHDLRSLALRRRV